MSPDNAYGRFALHVPGHLASSAGPAIRECPGVDRLVTVEHGRFVVEQMGDVFEERVVVFAEFWKCNDAFMTRVDFEDRLGRGVEPVGGVEQPLELPVWACSPARPSRPRFP